ncbi:MAG TPA: GNAT family N-acetyltransferase [Microlunatus sp.]|nr:GNAT family N-acetyltransferase [Microlunatus sp.]
MTTTVRPLTVDDAEASRRLGWEAFGFPAKPPTDPASATLDTPGRHFFGAFHDDRLAARMAWRDYDSWFGGRLVRTAGIASVTVAAEDRGTGLLTPLFAEALRDAHAAGAVISTLFPSAAGIYRRFGYELVSDYVTVSLPSAVVAAVPRPAPPAGVRTRRAGAADLPALREVYDTWAAAQNGPLSRRGVSFPASDAELLEEFSGFTVAVAGDDSVCGYTSWNRGQGYGPGSKLEVSDLIALSADGYRALLAALGSFAPVTPTTTIDTSGNDLARLLLASTDWAVSESSPYGLAVLDVVGALTARDFPPGVYAQLPFRLRGMALPQQDGTYVLQVADGASVCERSRTGDDRTLAPRGLALLYAGVQSCANLRFAGLLTGGDPRHDPLWDCLFAGRPMHIRDYF